MHPMDFFEQYSGYTKSKEETSIREAGVCTSCKRASSVRYKTGQKGKILCAPCNFLLRNHDPYWRLSIGAYALIKKSGSIFFIKPGTHEKFDFAIDESKAQIITDYNEASFIRRVLNVENENYISIAFGKASLNTDNLAINDYRYDYVNMGGNSIGGFNKSAVLSSKSHLQSIPEKKLLEYIQHLKAKRGEEAKSRFEERKKFRMKYPSVTNVDFSAMTSNDLTNLQKILKK